jgi:glycosyltransferase involved in cell wall biosynthesis
MLHILLIDDKVPDPSFGAGFPRAYRLLLSLIELGHAISFFPTNRQSVVGLDVEALKKFNVTVVDDVKDLKGIDVAIISRPHNVHYHMPLVKKCHPKTKIIYDTEALWYRRYDLQLAITGRLPWWSYRYDEINLAQQVDFCFVVNNEEKEILHANGVKNVKVLAHALNVHKQGKVFSQRKDFLVVGGILEVDSSNEDGLWHYLETAWSNVHAKTGAVLNVTGHKHTERLVNNTFPEVNLMGLVDNLVPLYETQKVFVASTRFATGIPWKCHEAMAHGCPCVISELLAHQLKLRRDLDAMVANTAEEFVEKSIKLYNDPELWHKVRENAFELIRRDCCPENFKNILQATLVELFS